MSRSETTYLMTTITMKMVREHDTTLPFHAEFGRAVLEPGVVYRDRLGRHGADTWRWRMLRCTVEDCPFEALVLASDLDDAFDRVTKARKA